ncbi:nucleobindin-2-like isoform X2 [Amphiura filiformis]|uniref:nucleobindin-2-like isoform X2 n=1 Tax=Amphiura filiformis TaxID=82378 RepID=UPI003B225D48
MARWQYLLGIFSLLLVLCNGLPVLPKEEIEDEGLLEEEDTGLEYDRYLRQVIKVLEKDPDMRKRMEELSLEDLKEGNFARELGFLSTNIRSKLDELKRLEVQRLRTVARQRMEAAAGKADMKRQLEIDGILGHVDVENPHTFEEKDFVQLIEKAAADLDEADKERRKEFKRYEMEKELQRRQQLKDLDETKRLKAEDEYKQRKERIKNHPKIKHPGSKAQMQEVWEETDHLDPNDFNPKTFFALHDTNGDKKLDMFELEALFIKEVDKIYKDADEADPVELAEEVSRMREHVMREIDLDGDKMVSRDEFMKAADQAQFENDDGWKDINQDEQFTEEELQEYNRMVQERLERKKIRMQEEHDRFVKEQNINMPNSVQMNQQQQQFNQQQQGQDPKLRVNQPPINNQVPVNQGQVPAQQAGQPIQQGQPPVNQAGGQVPPQQQAGGQPVQQGQRGAVPPNVAQNQQQQQQQLNQQLNQQQQINLQQQQQQKINQQQQQLNQQQNINVQQGQPKPPAQAQGQPVQHVIQGGQPAQPPQGGAQVKPVQNVIQGGQAPPAQGGAQGKPVQNVIQGGQQPPAQPPQGGGQPVQNVIQGGQPPAQPPQGGGQPVQNVIQGGQPPAQPPQGGGQPVQNVIQGGQPPAQPPQGGVQGQPPAQPGQGANPPGQ